MVNVGSGWEILASAPSIFYLWCLLIWTGVYAWQVHCHGVSTRGSQPTGGPWRCWQWSWTWAFSLKMGSHLFIYLYNPSSCVADNQMYAIINNLNIPNRKDFLWNWYETWDPPFALSGNSELLALLPVFDGIQIFAEMSLLCFELQFELFVSFIYSQAVYCTIKGQRGANRTSIRFNEWIQTYQRWIHSSCDKHRQVIILFVVRQVFHWPISWYQTHRGSSVCYEWMPEVWAGFWKTFQVILVLMEDQEGGKGAKKAAKELRATGNSTMGKFKWFKSWL